MPQLVELPVRCLRLCQPEKLSGVGRGLGTNWPGRISHGGQARGRVDKRSHCSRLPHSRLRREVGTVGSQPQNAMGRNASRHGPQGVGFLVYVTISI